MTILRKVAAVLLVCAMVFSFAACHEKGEIAVTVKYGESSLEFTSAMYLCALMNAETEAYGKVQEILTEKDVKTEDITEELFYSQKIDDKEYYTWITDRAKEIISEWAAYKFMCDAGKLEISSEDLTSLESYVSYYWYNGGYGQVFEPNGVSFNTYKHMSMSTVYAQTYFDSIYAEGGTNPVAKDEILKAMDENFTIANIIEVDTSQMKDSEKKAAKEKLDGYAARLKKGEKFEKIYNEYYEIKETTSSTTSGSSTVSSNTSSTTSNTASNTTSSGTEEKELEPKDAYASLIGDEDTDYASDYFKTVKEMKVGEVKVITDEPGKKLVLVVAGDMMSDEYWTTNLVDLVLSMLKQDEFDKGIDELIKKFDINIDNDAISAFDVKNLYKYSK